MGLTTDPEEARNSGIDPNTGMQNTYVVLSDEERAKGFVEPVRTAYKHVGRRPVHPTRPLTDEEHERYDEYGYVLFETYPEGNSFKGRYWTQEQLDSGCGTVTTMALPIAETYARNPGYYGGTFCAGCGTHRPVGADGEFVWVDPSGQLTTQRVGTTLPAAP